MAKLSESFVPSEILNGMTQLAHTLGVDSKSVYNNWIRKNHPNVPNSTRTRWVRAFMDGTAHSQTPSWHVRYREDSSIIPARFSAIANKRFFSEREKWKQQRWIRYVNWGCWHQPFGDGAILSLAAQIVRQFDPNVVPMLSDFLDADRFSTHAKKAGDADQTVLDAEVARENDNRYHELHNLTRRCNDVVTSCVSPDATKLALLGNHEDRIFRWLLSASSLNGDQDVADVMIENYMELLQDLDILWVEMDRRQLLPLTKDFWVGHGTKAKSGEAATAKAYMNQVKSTVSIAAVHSHRQEVLWSKTPYSEHFYAVAGTLGPIQRGYNRNAFVGHNVGFQLITQPFEGWRGATVEDVRINYTEGYYVAHYRGKEYSEKATVEYNELLDLTP